MSTISLRLPESLHKKVRDVEPDAGDKLLMPSKDIDPTP